MRFRDNWRLSLAPIKAKKWRHSLVIVTMALVLGLVVAMGLGIAGLEQAVRTAEPTSGEPVGQVMDLALSNVGVMSALDLFLAAVPVKTPFTAYAVNTEETFAGMWNTYMIISGVLLAVSLVIIVMTLSRLLGQETKNQKIYQARGATLGDLRRIYGGYTLILGVLVCLMAIVLGVTLTAVLSIVYATPLTQVFELAYGVQEEVWLVGWNWRILLMFGIVLVTMTLTGVLGAKSAKARKTKK